VDGTGLQAIEDKEIADKILKKVNDMNKKSPSKALLPTLIYAALAIPVHQVIASWM